MNSTEIAYVAAALEMLARMVPPGTAGIFRGEETDAGDVARNALAVLRQADRRNAPSQPGACREDMSPAERAACDARAIRDYPAQQLARARHNGFATVAEYEACQRYGHGGA